MKVNFCMYSREQLPSARSPTCSCNFLFSIWIFRQSESSAKFFAEDMRLEGMRLFFHSWGNGSNSTLIERCPISFDQNTVSVLFDFSSQESCDFIKINDKIVYDDLFVFVIDRYLFQGVAVFEIIKDCFLNIVIIAFFGYSQKVRIYHFLPVQLNFSIEAVKDQVDA